MGNIRKKGKIAISTLIAIVILLILALVVILPGGKILWRSKSSFEALGPSKCTDADKVRKITEFNKTIELYGRRTRVGSTATNELYSPEDSLKQFKVYLACKEDGAFTDEEIKKHDKGIMEFAKTVYVNYAEDLCKEMEKAQSGSKDEQKDIRDEYSDLADDYYAVYDNDITRPANCRI